MNPSESAAATPPNAEDLANQVANELPSPYCPGRSIASCPSELARVLEQDILEQAKAGQSREEIETALVARFGEEKMGSEFSGELAVVITLVGLLAIVVVVMGARRWVKKPTEATEKTGAGESDSKSSLSEAELDRLEDALDEVEEF